MRRTIRSQLGSRHQELRLNCSADVDYIDPFGLTWVPDGPFIGTGVTIFDRPDAASTPYPTLFNTLRYNPGGFTYNLTIDNGTYNIHLFWSETYFTQVGEIIFGLAIQGTTLLTNFDLIQEAGGQNIAVTRIFKAVVTNRTLKINFLPGSADHPSISAMAITRSNSLRR